LGSSGENLTAEIIALCNIDDFYTNWVMLRTFLNSAKLPRLIF
jgi:hypothetical protein